MLIKLTEECNVAARTIVHITVQNGGYGVLVKTEDGTVHRVSNDYGKGSYETKDRLVAMVNAAMTSNLGEGV